MQDALQDAPAVDLDGSSRPDLVQARTVSRHDSATSLRELWSVLVRRWRLVLLIEGGLLLGCLVYCLVAPNEYEASAKVELRTSPASSLILDAQQNSASASVLSAPATLETIADVFRSDRLAWRVIRELKLDQAPGFCGDFSRRFPGLRPDSDGGAGPAAQAWLLERFERRLHVETLPRTLIIEIRFRSRDATLSATVVNALVRDYGLQENEAQIDATTQAAGWLNAQLLVLKANGDRDAQRLVDFEKAHGIVSAPEPLAGGAMSETGPDSTLVAIDELSRQLVAATTDRILREGEYRASSAGDPELVIASDPRLQTAEGGFVTAPLQQIRARRSDLEQERAQLSAEHGENFPRVAEINRQLQDLDRQKQAEDARLVERFRSAWQGALDREQMLRKSLSETTGEGMKQNQAATEYAAMRQEANASHELYMRVQEKVEEAGLAAGIHDSNLAIVDPARQPVKPVAPDLPLYLAITFFAGLVALGCALLVEEVGKPAVRSMGGLLALLLVFTMAYAQAPTPSTSGLPTGVARFPQSTETRSQPNAKEAPAVWNGPTVANSGAPVAAGATAAVPAEAIIGPGDFLEISEYHTPEFRSQVRVSSAGAVTLPMIGEVQISGLDEQAAAHAIEGALKSKDMLLHPLVSVVVTASAGQNVSVLGEVARPGVYPYTAHHRLLDVISEAAGLAPAAGRLVNVIHRNDPDTPHAVVLDPNGSDPGADHNPELSPGDTVQVSRAGLVFVVGDVIRPGGFPVDPVQKLTVVQALALAWGPTQNAAMAKGLLIREQKDGRTVTALNLKRLLRGQDPDQTVQDGDIVYVPDSAAKNLLNRTMESAIQSAVGVTIYSGLVYSQRY